MGGAREVYGGLLIKTDNFYFVRFFGDYRVSPNFLLCWGWVVVEVGLGCDKKSLYD